MGIPPPRQGALAQPPLPIKEEDTRELLMAFVSGALQGVLHMAGHAIADRVRAVGRQQNCRTLSSSPGPTGTFPTALQGDDMTMDDDLFVVAAWHCLDICIRVPTGMPSEACQS